MMLERKILEALDACRPGSADLTNPEHPELAEAAQLAKTDAQTQLAVGRLKQFDARLQAALEDVEVPAGLAVRVTYQLIHPQPTLSPASVSPAESSGSANRRQFVWNTMAAVAASVLVAAGVWSFFRPTGAPLSRTEFESLSRDWHRLAVQENQWNKNLDAAPAERRFPQESLLVNPRAFQMLNLPGDHRAVAYDVSFGNRRATVIVYRGQLPDLDLVPPRKPFLGTQGTCIGVWQRDGLLFALVVEGRDADYRSLLQSNQGRVG